MTSMISRYYARYNLCYSPLSNEISLTQHQFKYHIAYYTTDDCKKKMMSVLTPILKIPGGSFQLDPAYFGLFSLWL